MIQQSLRLAHATRRRLPPFFLSTTTGLVRRHTFRVTDKAFYSHSTATRKARVELRMSHTPMSHYHSTPTDHGRDDRNGVHLDLDPHNYTSGRWLRNDDEERASRYIKFDFDALRRKVLTLSPGAFTITQCQKLEGGFNRVFIFELDNDKRVVARLPFSLAGPAQLTTSSEIATIEYRKFLSSFFRFTGLWCILLFSASQHYRSYT